MQPKHARRAVLGGMGFLALGACATAPPAAQGAFNGAAATTQVYELTFLKAKPGLKSQLMRYIVANWYVMDARAVEQGLFTEYRLLEATTENEAWDGMMMVGYPKPEGFSDPATAAGFEAIRQAHVRTPIEGKHLRDLGGVVGVQRVRVAAPG
jgi:hypothetical protein